MESVAIILIAALMWSVSQWMLWRKRALYYHDLCKSVENNLQPAQDMINALSDERRLQHYAMMEVFDYLNDNNPFGSHQEGLMQCKNVLLHAIQNSTYRPGENGTGS